MDEREELARLIRGARVASADRILAAGYTRIADPGSGPGQAVTDGEAEEVSGSLRASLESARHSISLQAPSTQRALSRAFGGKERVLPHPLEAEAAALRARLTATEAALAEAVEALRAVVNEYPVAAGLVTLPGEDEHGYGSIRAARAALARINAGRA